MVLVSKKLAAQMESCIKQTHIEMAALYQEGRVLEINGGAACFSGYDSYLSQVVGWGFASASLQFKSEIEKIEYFYQSLGHTRVDIELCPFVGNELVCFLAQRGYQVTEVNNVSILELEEYNEARVLADGFVIREIRADEFDLWAKQVALGFEYPEAEEQFSYYIRARGVTGFAVFHQEKLIAGASVAIHGNICDMAVTSTLPHYRGLGLQKKLLEMRLNFAKKQGVQFAIVTTEPGSISDLNSQKVGFRCAYTRIKMSFGEVN